MTTKEAVEIYENACDEVKTCIDILETMSKEKIKDFILFMQFAKEDEAGANWIMENFSKLNGLSFYTMIQLAKNELYGDTE